MLTWPPDTGGCWCCHHSAADHGRPWTGACILMHRSTNYAAAAAELKPSFRTATPARHSATPSWLCRRAPPPLEPVTTKAEPWPGSSPNSGVDARTQPTREAGRHLLMRRMADGRDVSVV